MGKKNNIRSPWPILIVIVAGVGFNGCSSGPTSSSLGLLDSQGNHPSGWVAIHPGFARPDGRACTECHGSVTDEAQSGGIANVSCFTASRNGVGCHANGPAFHPLNWLDKAGSSFHGTAFANNVLINGRECTVCHDPNNPAEPPGFICLDCHFTVDGQRVPSGSAYVHGQITGHSAFLSDNAVNSVCQRCHETNNTFGQMPQPFCHNCHEPFPMAFHPTGWANPDAHGPSAKSAPGVASGFAFCQTCHGDDFAGTGNAPSCLNNAFCHGSGVVSPHAPSPWRLGVRTHTNTAEGNADVCALCHLGGGSVVITPPTPVPGGVTPGCFNNTLCHGDVTGAPHAVRPFPDHPARARAEFDTFCNSCHDITPPRRLESAPVCTECHTGGDPLAVANCASCHADPPDGLAPVGDVFPNIEGGHAEHNALDNVAGICDACHNGGGTSTGLQHFYNSTVNVAFQNLLFKANSGNLLFTAADNTCSNVSCHGGIKTPNWRTGTIDVLADSGPTPPFSGCRQCHTAGTAEGDPENNSPFSGLHTFHLATTQGGAILCTECHDMGNGTQGADNHFQFLNTPGMEGPAADTVEPNGSAANYNASGKTCGTFTCHGEPHNNFPWEGGANHSVPFTGPGHTSVTSTSFPNDCGPCHFETGTATRIGPTCTVCHQAGSPLSALSCTSCHADPPSGSTYPNIAGRHGVHDVLAGVTGVCDACHTGLTSGTQAHYDRGNARPGKDALRTPPGDVVILSTYDDEPAGGPTFSSAALTCSRVSCHGGQTTPNFRTGTIDVNTDAGCVQCHAFGTAQFNSFNSGEHDRHVNKRGFPCRECHNMSLATPGAQNHFAFLETPQMEGPASDTFQNSTGTVVYTPGTPGTGTCTGTCHNKNHNNRDW